jgi:hypothetical protein
MDVAAVAQRLHRHPLSHHDPINTVERNGRGGISRTMKAHLTRRHVI